MLLAADAEKNGEMNDGSTPIFIAAYYGHHSVVELLLAAGADKNAAKRDGLTPMMIADLQGHDMIV